MSKGPKPGKRSKEPAATPLPSGPSLTREQLLAQHVEARRRRDASPLGSGAFRDAAEEVSRIEVEIARVERSMDPPQM